MVAGSKSGSSVGTTSLSLSESLSEPLPVDPLPVFEPEVSQPIVLPTSPVDVTLVSHGREKSFWPRAASFA